eukprot:g17787.t1
MELTSAAARSYVERIRFLPRVNGAVGSINDEPEVEVLYGLSPADDPNELSLQRVFELIQGPDYALPTKLYAFYCFFGLALSGCHQKTSLVTVVITKIMGFVWPVRLPEDEDEEEGEILPLLTKDANDGTGGLSLRQWAGKMLLLAASRQAVEDGLRHVLLASLGSSCSAGAPTRGSGKAPTSAKMVFLRGLYGSGLLVSMFFAVAGSSVVKKECVVFDPGTTSPTLEDPHLQKQNLLLEPDVASALASTRWLWRWTNEEEEHADCIATSSAGISMLLLDFIGPLVVDFLPFERGGALRKHRALSLHTTAIFTTLACAGLFLLAIVDAGVGGSVEGSPDTTRASNKTKTFSFISDHHAELHPRTKSQRAAFEFRAKDYDTGSEQVVQVLAV